MAMSGAASPMVQQDVPKGKKVAEWALWTIATIAIMFGSAELLFGSIRGCAGVESCVEAFTFDIEKTQLNCYAIVGLSTAFILELVSLHFSYESAKPVLGLVNGLDNTFVPPVLLCVTLFVLILENMVFAFSDSPWFAAASAAGMPVYTSIYVEWLINVPILLVLAGSCALHRTVREVKRPLIITNVYIVFAWTAHFVLNYNLRWLLVCVTFVMYGVASKDMVAWAQAYKSEIDPDVSGIHLRQASTFGLIAFFGLYGVVYLSRLTGVLDHYQERVWYLCMNITTKLIMLMLFGGIRSSRYHDLIVNMLVNTHFSFRRQVAVLDPEAAGNGDEGQDLYKQLIEH